MLGLARSSTVQYYRRLAQDRATERHDLFTRYMDDLVVQRDNAELKAVRAQLQILELENSKLRIAAKLPALRASDV